MADEEETRQRAPRRIDPSVDLRRLIHRDDDEAAVFSWLMSREAELLILLQRLDGLELG